MSEPSYAGNDAGEEIFPLSFSQRRLWLLDQLAPGRATYHIASAFRIGIALHAKVLAGALNEIVRRHEVLRTTFRTGESGEPVQVIAPQLAMPLPVVDLTALPAAARLGEAHRRATDLARAPFDLAGDALLRCQLLILGEADHVFVLVMHHIVSDGWSMGILFDELSALYGALAASRPSPLPELPVQYADYAVWQSEWLQGETLAAQMDYWRRQLAGISVLKLPTDRRRPALSTQRGASHYLDLDETLTAALKALSRQAGATLFMTLLAAFQVLLHRLTGQDDIVVGSPTAGRNRAELEKLIGFFVNMLVLRGDLSGDPEFREVIRRVREVALGAYAHQDLPFEKLVEELQPARDLSRNPLFQVVFQLFQEGAGTGKAGQISTIQRLEVEKGTAIFDLAIALWEDGARLRGRIEYSTDLFAEETIARLAGNFQVLLEGIVANPQAPISTLPLLTGAERGRLLDEWSTSKAPAGAVQTLVGNARENCVHRLFEQQARRAPGALALASGPIRLSYGELNRRANQVAHCLRQLGVEPETRVALCFERSPALIVAALGVLKAGGAYLPLDPAWPRERLAFAIADANAAALLTETRWTERLPAGDLPTLCLDRDQQRLDSVGTSNPDGGAGAGNLAYVIYTSGSSGRPKGVLIEHESLANLVAWHGTTYAVTDRDRATLLASPAFDASVWETWAYLAAGASLHISEPETRDVPHLFVRWLNREGITLSFVPTPLAELLLLEDWSGPTALRALLTGGDRLHRRPDRPLPFRLFNHYGPTENCVVATATPVDCSDENDLPPIGRPIAGVHAYVLDHCGQLALIGAAGELYLGGAGLARGYLKQPGLTAEKFVANPFSRVPGARLYRTGDRVRFRSDGQLEFLGRIDQQVKVRGWRIELGEIEAVLASHPGVAEVTVAAFDSAGDRQHLVAYVVPQPGRQRDAQARPASPQVPRAVTGSGSHGDAGESGQPLFAELRELARAHLPEPMVPTRWLRLDALPLTANGKVDHAALPVPDPRQPPSTFEAPRTPLETELAALWSDLLGVARVGRHDEFFRQLGGHSLLATRLVSRIRKDFAVELPLRAVFEAPTVAGLALAILQQQAAAANEAALDRLLREVEALPEVSAEASPASEGNPQ